MLERFHKREAKRKAKISKQNIKKAQSILKVSREIIKTQNELFIERARERPLEIQRLERKLKRQRARLVELHQIPAEKLGKHKVRNDGQGRNAARVKELRDLQNELFRERQSTKPNAVRILDLEYKIHLAREKLLTPE